MTPGHITLTSDAVSGGEVSAHAPTPTARIVENYQPFAAYELGGFGHGFGPYSGAERPWYTATGTGQDRAYGRRLPDVWNEIDLRGYRLIARDLDSRNQFAIGFLDILTGYHIHKGYGWQACLKGTTKTPYSTASKSDPLVAKAQRILDSWRDAAKWPKRSREAFRRWRRDGEVFGRWFRMGHEAWPVFRFVDPALIGSPVGDTGTHESFGIRTDELDVETVEAYFVRDIDNEQDGEWVDAGEMIHVKANVDADVKRGVTDFLPLSESLDGVRHLLRNMLESSKRQAATAWIEKHQGFTLEQIRASLPHAAANLTTRGLPPYLPDSGHPYGFYRGYGAQPIEPPGHTKKVEGDREYLPTPGGGAVPNYIEALQACLRGCGQRYGMPEYFSGDASNNNFASSLVAGAPFVVNTVGRQEEWGSDWERPIALKVLDLAVGAGWLTQSEREKLDVQVTAPQVVNADPVKDSQVNYTMHAAGVLSATTWQLKAGLDPQHESENFEAEKAQGMQPGMEPGARGGPATAGGPAGGDSPPSPASRGGNPSDELAALAAKMKGGGGANTRESVDDSGHAHKDSGPGGGQFTTGSGGGKGRGGGKGPRASKSVAKPAGKSSGPKVVHADAGAGSHLIRHPDGTLETPLPDEPARKEIVAALAPAISKAWGDIAIMSKMNGGYMPAASAMLAIKRESPPGTKHTDVQAALWQLHKDGKIRLMELNETHKLTTPQENAEHVIWQGGRAYGFVQPKDAGGALDLSGYAKGGGSKESRFREVTDASGHEHDADGKFGSGGAGANSHEDRQKGRDAKRDAAWSARAHHDLESPGVEEGPEALAAHHAETRKHLENAGATDRELAEFDRRTAKGHAIVARHAEKVDTAKTKRDAAEKVLDDHRAAGEELAAAEPQEPEYEVEPEEPEEPEALDVDGQAMAEAPDPANYDGGETDPAYVHDAGSWAKYEEAHAGWQAEHKAWQKESAAVQKRNDKASAAHDRAWDAWDKQVAQHGNRESRLEDKLNEADDAHAAALGAHEEAHGGALEYVGEHVSETEDAIHARLDAEDEADEGDPEPEDDEDDDIELPQMDPDEAARLRRIAYGQESRTRREDAGTPPFPGAVFDKARHRWVKPQDATGGGGKGAAAPPPASHLTAGLAEKVAALDPEAAKSPGLLDKLKDKVAKVGARIYLFALQHTEVINKGVAVLEAVFDTPQDMKTKLGYDPATTSGTSHATTDGVKAATGISGHIAILAASHAAAAVVGWLKNRGKAEDAGDIDALAEVIAGILKELAAEFDLATPPDAATIAEHLRTL